MRWQVYFRFASTRSANHRDERVHGRSSGHLSEIADGAQWTQHLYLSFCCLNKSSVVIIWHRRVKLALLCGTSASAVEQSPSHNLVRTYSTGENIVLTILYFELGISKATRHQSLNHKIHHLLNEQYRYDWTNSIRKGPNIHISRQHDGIIQCLARVTSRLADIAYRW
jgi:hypothetical protein